MIRPYFSYFCVSGTSCKATSKSRLGFADRLRRKTKVSQRIPYACSLKKLNRSQNLHALK